MDEEEVVVDRDGTGHQQWHDLLGTEERGQGKHRPESDDEEHGEAEGLVEACGVEALGLLEDEFY